MIALNNHSIKPLNQDLYNDIIASWLSHRHREICPNQQCNQIGSMVIHGYYTRYFGFNDHEMLLRILRVRCLHCQSTHALLPLSIIAYSRCPMIVACQTIYARLCEEKPWNHIFLNFGMDIRVAKRMVRLFQKEFSSFHMNLFGSFFNLSSLSVHQLMVFFNTFKLLYLVRISKQKKLHFHLSMIDFTP